MPATVNSEAAGETLRAAGESFYLAPELWREPYLLEGPEAHHLLRVLRAKPGQVLRLFDGLGRVGDFEIDRCEKKSLDLTPLVIRQEPPPLCRTWLALGWNKASRRAWLLEKSVELNCAGLAFWQAERGQGQMPLAPKETWRAKLIAGAKQCGNAYLPELSLLPGGAAGIIAFAAGFEGRYLLLEAAPQAPLLEIEDLGQPGRNICVLGPEGGFADREIALLLAAGFLPRSLGRAILRWETAALQCLGLAFHAAQRSLV